MSGRIYPLKKKIEQTYFNAIQNLKFSTSGENVTKGSVIDNLKNNIAQLKELKSQITALFLDSGNKFEKYNNKLNNAKQDHSIKLYQQKVDRYRGEVLELIMKMQTIDDSIKNMESTIENILKEGTGDTTSTESPEPTNTDELKTDAS
jgi:predicted  nucleic acid-binding Zn-ribbon protein